MIKGINWFVSGLTMVLTEDDEGEKSLARRIDKTCQSLAAGWLMT
jgi:hypothetical protein